MALGVNIISEFDAKGINKAIRDFKKLETAGEKTAFALQSVDAGAMKMGKALFKFGAIAIGVGGIIGKNLVDAASNLEESQSKVNVVFGSGAKAVTDFASNTAVSMGISKQAALEATGTYGNLIQAFGLGQDKAQTMSTTLVQLAGDLASFNNTSVEAALTALRSGLSGEAEPLKRYGVAINDVRLKAEAMSMGLYDGNGTLSTSAKLQAAYALILKDTSLAQGDYARTADGIANSQRTVGAQFEDVKAKIGESLVPAYKSLLGYIQDNVLPTFTKFADVLGEKGVGAAFAYLGGAILDGIANLGLVGDAVLILAGLFVTLRVATVTYTAVNGILTVLLPLFATSLTGATAAQTALNVAMKANMIGLIIAAIVAVIAILVMLYVKFEVVRKVINFVINAIIGYLEFLVNSWIKVFNTIAGAINKVTGLLKYVGVDIPKIGTLGEVSFGRLGDAAIGAKGKVEQLGKSVQQLIREADRVVPFDAGDSGGGGGGGGGGAAKVIKTFKEKVKEYVDALKSRTSAERDVKTATDSVTKANIKAALTTDKLKIAQLEFNDVFNGFGIGSKQAKEKQIALAKAQRNVERAGYDVEASVYSVSDAEKALAAERANPESSLQTIREREIALAEAKLSTRDATDSQMDATTDLAEAERLYEEAVNGAKEGSDAYTKALDKLNDAKQAQIDAVDDVAEAYIRQADAVDKLGEAIEKLVELQKTTGAKAISVAESKIPVIPTGATPATGSTPTAGAGSFDYSDPFGLKGLDFTSFEDFAARSIGEISGPYSPPPQPINLTVNAGLGADGATIGKEIIDYVLLAERRGGKVFASA